MNIMCTQLGPPKEDLARVIRVLRITDRITDQWRKTHTFYLVRAGFLMREQRKLRKISLRALAQKLGVSAPFLSDMELGRRKYSIEWSKKAFRIMLDWKHEAKHRPPAAHDPAKPLKKSPRTEDS